MSGFPLLFHLRNKCRLMEQNAPHLPRPHPVRHRRDVANFLSKFFHREKALIKNTQGNSMPFKFSMFGKCCCVFHSKGWWLDHTKWHIKHNPMLPDRQVTMVWQMLKHKMLKLDPRHFFLNLPQCFWPTFSEYCEHFVLLWQQSLFELKISENSDEHSTRERERDTKWTG